MLCGWEGSSRSGVALAMHDRLSGLSTYGLKGQCTGDEHPTYALLKHGPLLHTDIYTIIVTLAISHLGGDSKDLIGRYDVAEKTRYSFTYTKYNH